MSAKTITPEIYIVSTSTPAMGSLLSYLADIGVTEEDWHFDENSYRSNDPEQLIEFAGRLCYKSFGTNLNPNITKIREDPTLYIANIIESGHGSVLEHVHISIVLRNVSRVLTHELVRHRHGNFSQESMRYVRLEEIEYWYPQSFYTLYPPSIQSADDETKLEFRSLMEEWFGQRMAIMGEWQEELAKLWELDKIKDFHTKKLLTSAFRRLAPHGVATQIMWTTNLRELRHVIEQRTSVGAEEEIRQVFGLIATACKLRFPKAFADFTFNLDKTDPLQIPIWYSTVHTKV